MHTPHLLHHQAAQGVKIHISNIVQSSLLEVDELKKKWYNEKKQIGAKKKRDEGKKTTVVHTDGKKTSELTISCEGCKELRIIVAQLQQSYWR